MPSQTTYIVCPSNEELETAWWNLMQGELGLDEDNNTRDFMQMIFDHVRKEVDSGVPMMTADGDELNVVTSAEMAKRMVAAYAVLFYG